MPGSNLRLLALDGGVRGLSALLILEQLMKTVDPDAPPKPCDVLQCITACLPLSNRVFCKTRHRVTLARAVKEVAKQQGLQGDALLKDRPDAGCMLITTALCVRRVTVCLTSYRTPRRNSGLLNSVQIWEACRATSLAWGPGLLEGKVKCVVSIGTGVPSLKPFKDDMLHIVWRERSLLDNTRRYFRFNVVRGLEVTGLEEAKEMALWRICNCLQSRTRTESAPDRPAEMVEMEQVLLPRPGQSQRQKTHTRLAVEFARRHHGQSSSDLWLDGRSKDTLRRSIASCACRIPYGYIAETSRTKDLWHGLFTTACATFTVGARMLSRWIRDIASSKVTFSGATQMFRNRTESTGVVPEKDKQETVLDAIHLLGVFYVDQSKLGEAEKMSEWALRGYEEALGYEQAQQ
ncbi:hypothetical protein HBI73_245120 [Parastagonospora nodorum]|nr:hypothetical protein HBI05_252500 [Parastagonospora nodorum]KAH4893140.1 hypothetical protein HBI80_253070 [Parastagonospora nodorum]KAH5050096.1 hypothetical protein HBI73_245120 [Parastagonospora nodorum]KAH5750828.1 hypothetical protein HBI16_255120 [Parastagonospora nodorum]KAH6243930.1 hypothetical protein HBI41_255310 [Parastagonospora nodorum]